jgi:hypothetical protein
MLTGSDGLPGYTIGGGGGGCRKPSTTTRYGGAGARGEIRITYTLASNMLQTVVSNV